MKLRRAVPADLSAVYVMLEQAFEESPVDLPEIAPEKAWQRIRGIIESQFCLVIEHEGEVAGSIAITAGDLWWSDKPALMDAWFYVRPDYRKTRAAVTLMSTARDFAREKGLPLILGVSAGGDVERKDAFYKRQHLTAIGGLYVEGM